MTLSDLRHNRNLLFWGLHSLGWSAFLIAQYIGALLYEKPAGHIKAVVVMALSGFLLTAPLRYVYRWLWGRRPYVIIPAVLLSCWLTALVWRVVVNTSSEDFRKAFREQVARRRAEIDRVLRRSKVDVIDVETGEPYVRALMRFFKERASRQ